MAANDDGRTLRPYPTRRAFLAATAAAAAAPTVWTPATGGNELPALRVDLTTPASRVVKVAAREVVSNTAIHRPLLREMLSKAITALARTDVESDAWHSYLRDDDVIALKFNRSAQAKLRTTDAMADTLIHSLVEAGFSPAQIVCVEVPDQVRERNGTAAPLTGFSSTETTFSSGSDQLAAVLDQVTAIINVPFLKTHNIAGMTCALKNLSHSLVKHPARYHDGGCSPYIADILAIPSIRSKVRLTIVDAIRVVYDGGPEALTGATRNPGLLLASTDPVAVDAIGLEILNDTRRLVGLGPVAQSAASLPYLRSSHEAGLGVAARYAIDLVQPLL